MSTGLTACPAGKWTAMWNAPNPGGGVVLLAGMGGPSPYEVGNWKAYGAVFPFFMEGTVKAYPDNQTEFFTGFVEDLLYLHVDLQPTTSALALRLSLFTA